MKKIFLLSLLVLGGFFGSSSFGLYITSSNILSEGCTTFNTTCDLSNKSITGIASDTFLGYTNLKTLILSNNQISSIESGAFNGLGDFYQLDLSFNQITGVSNIHFNGFSSLWQLMLVSNQITTLESGDFSELPSLSGLTLYSNQITHIKNGAFNGLPNLAALYLYSNQITTIEPGAFDGLSNLTQLLLYSNNITTLSSGMFRGLSNLPSMFLSSNQITTIEPGAFNGLSHLNQLDISFNKIANIASGAFDGFSSLTTLNLNSNQITSIGNLYFNGLSSLQDLYVDSNQITTIQSGDFHGLPNLAALSLNSNQILHVHTGVFNGLPNLATLYLYSNHILTIDSGALTELPLLSSLDISYNCIDISTLSQSIIDLANFTRGDTSRQTNEYVCIDISYSPYTSTAGQVIGTLIFTGGTQANRDALALLYPTLSDTYHIWTENNVYGLNISSLNSPLLHHNNPDYPYALLTGSVTWITGSVVSQGGSSRVVHFIQADMFKAIKDALVSLSSVDTHNAADVADNPFAYNYIFHYVAKDPRVGDLKTYSSEMNFAHNFAYSVGITSIANIADYGAGKEITRAQAAKQFVEFAKLLGKQLDLTISCVFTDISTQLPLAQQYIKEACQMGLMGVNVDQFRPKELLTRAEISTILSRALWGSTYNQKDSSKMYYDLHMQALNVLGIINVMNPALVETRQNTLLMLYRTYKLIEKNTQDQQTSSEASSGLSMQKIGPTGNPGISVSRVGGSAQTKK